MRRVPWTTITFFLSKSMPITSACRIWTPAEQLAERHDGIGGMDAGRGDLGQQRLEHEIIIGVDQLDLELARPCRSSALAANTPPKPPPITRTFFFATGCSIERLSSIARHTYADVALRQVTLRAIAAFSRHRRCSQWRKYRLYTDSIPASVPPGVASTRAFD